MSLNTDIEVLRRVPFFARFGEEHLRLLAFGGENRTYSANQTLFRAGDASDGGLVVLRGRIVLSSGEHDDDGEGYEPASLFGQRALLAATHRRQTATAQVDSEVMLIRRTLFLRMLAEFPDLAQKLHQDMSMELRQLTDEASALVARSNGRLRR